MLTLHMLFIKTIFHVLLYHTCSTLSETKSLYSNKSKSFVQLTKKMKIVTASVLNGSGVSVVTDVLEWGCGFVILFIAKVTTPPIPDCVAPVELGTT